MTIYNKDQYRLISKNTASRKYKCPYCNRYTYAPYIDIKTGDYVGKEVGDCNGCRRHLTPDGFFSSRQTYRGSYNKVIVYKKCVKLKLTRCHMISPYLADQTKNHYEQNNFVVWLKRSFNNTIVHELIERFQIGTASHLPGATVFWQIDWEGHVRTGKLMLYDPVSGDFLREEWAHNILKRNYEYWEEGLEYNLDQCLFGEHQLGFEPRTRPIALVKSEKTAIIASLYKPEYIWMATGEMANLCPQKLMCLTERDVHFFPDLGAYDEWAVKLQEIDKQVNLRLFLHDEMERNAFEEDRQQGLHIADYLARNQPTLVH